MFKVLASFSLLFATAQAGGASTCASAWKSTGGGNCQLAVAICLAESGGNTHARNVNSDSHHSVDRGLWQVNNYWHPEVSDSCAYDASCNARAAKSISSGGSNWTPWATYNGGAYRAHMSAAASACGGGGYLKLIDNILQETADLENVDLETADLETADLETADLRNTLVLYHEYESRCAVLTIPGGHASKFWKKEHEKYDHFKKGRCPSIYVYANKRIDAIEGFHGVSMAERGIHRPVRSFRDVVAVGQTYSCPADPCGCCPSVGTKCPCLCGGGWCKRCCK